MNAIEKKIDAIERILDKADADPDEAAIWFRYGFSAKDVKRYTDMKILDPHTAEAIRLLGSRVGLIERRRALVLRDTEESAQA